jgi:hypothetical protein
MAGGKILLSAGHNKTFRARNNVFVTTTSSVIDLNDNSMLAASFATVGGISIRTLLKNARNGGAWTGNGLTSTAAKNDATHHTALGYAAAFQVLPSIGGGSFTFHNQTVTTNEVVVKYTYYGDSDLDGDADGVDIGRWATNFTGELGGGASATHDWFQGDWDYDGDVDGADASLWAAAFTGELGGGGLNSVVVNDPTINPKATAILQGMGITVVPEPTLTTLAILGLGGPLLFRIRGSDRA